MIQVDGYIAQTLASIDDLYEISEPFSIFYAFEERSGYKGYKNNGILGDYTFIHRTSDCTKTPINVSVEVIVDELEILPSFSALKESVNTGVIYKIDGYVKTYITLEELIKSLPKKITYRDIFIKLLSQKGNA